MKLVSNMLENIEGIELYYIIGLLIFFTLFVVIIVHTLKRPGKEMTEIKNSILNDTDSDELITS